MMDCETRQNLAAIFEEHARRLERRAENCEKVAEILATDEQRALALANARVARAEAETTRLAII
jgi:hypothetical protein